MALALERCIILKVIILLTLNGCGKMSMRMFHSMNKTTSAGFSFTNANLVFDGNSWTNYGAPCFPSESYGPWDKYPNQLLALSPWSSNGSTINNRATSGQTTGQMIAGGACAMDGSGVRGTAEAYVDSQLSLTRPNILVAWEVGNDLFFNGNATDAYNRIVTYCNTRRAAGWKVVVGTPLFRQYLAGPTPAGDTWSQYNTKIANICSLMRTNWSTFADAIADMNAAPELDDPLDGTYFVDGVHPSGAGRAVVAQIVSNAILTIN